MLEANISWLDCLEIIMPSRNARVTLPRVVTSPHERQRSTTRMRCESRTEAVRLSNQAFAMRQEVAPHDFAPAVIEKQRKCCAENDRAFVLEVC